MGTGTSKIAFIFGNAHLKCALLFRELLIFGVVFFWKRLSQVRVALSRAPHLMLFFWETLISSAEDICRILWNYFSPLDSAHSG